MIHTLTTNYDYPPEVYSDNQDECAECRVMIDLDQDEYTDLASGGRLCDECVELCASEVCRAKQSDPKSTIYMRDRHNGRLRPWCPECAAEEWLLELQDSYEYAAIAQHVLVKRFPSMASSFTWVQIEELYLAYMHFHAADFRKEQPCS